MSRVVCIVQARMGSTRLSGKVLKELAGRPVLWHVVKRLKECKRVDQVIVATSTADRDDAVRDLCWAHGFDVFRGDEYNVLSRYHGAASQAGAGTIVRVTADCPLIDPRTVDETIIKFFSGNYDYVSNCFPTRTFPHGFDTEVFSFAALDRALADARDPYETEHVTPYFYRNPQKFSVGSLAAETDRSAIRITLDTPEDYLRLSAIYRELYHDGSIIPVEKVIERWQEFNLE